MAGSVEPYNLSLGEKRCVIVQDLIDPPVTEIVSLFENLGFTIDFQRLPSGLAYDWLKNKLKELASCNDGHASCLALYFAGCCLNNGQLTVNRTPFDFQTVIEPFAKSNAWRGKPKLFFFQVSRTNMPLSADVGPIAPKDPSVFPVDWSDFAMLRAGRNMPVALQLALTVELSRGQDFRTSLLDLIRQKYIQLEAGVSVDFFASVDRLLKPLYLR